MSVISKQIARTLFKDTDEYAHGVGQRKCFYQSPEDFIRQKAERMTASEQAIFRGTEALYAACVYEYLVTVRWLRPNQITLEDDPGLSEQTEQRKLYVSTMERMRIAGNSDNWISSKVTDRLLKFLWDGERPTRKIYFRDLEKDQITL
jgi:hypothetical protein